MFPGGKLHPDLMSAAGVKGAIALQSCGLQFIHPDTGRIMNFTLPLPDTAPWNLFAE